MITKPITRRIYALLFLLCVVMSLTACDDHTEKQSEENTGDIALFSDYDYSANTIKKGAEYSFGVDQWDMYVATAISDKLIRVVNWEKDSSDEPSFEEEKEIGVFQIDDPAVGFIWIDNEHTAFYINLQDDSESSLKHGRSVPFTVMTTDSNRNKGANYADDVVSYLYEYDNLYSYHAILLSPTTVKIEAWRLHSGILWDKVLYAYDVLVINTEKTATDFEWTDSEHTSFSISMMDPENGNYWDEKKLVYFIVENEELLGNITEESIPPAVTESIDSVISSGQEMSNDKAKMPVSATEYSGKDYEEVVSALMELGFTNIAAEPIYDIYFATGKARTVKSVSIGGINDFESESVFDKDSEIIVIYRMPYTDDPSYIKMPHESEYYDGMNYLEVEQLLKDLGFTNIDLDEMSSSYHEDGEVFSVLKGNHPFNEGDPIKNDEKITINYYVAEKPVVLETLTIDNNDQFAVLMKITDQTDATTIRAFVNAHIGDVIEFDGCIAFLMNHGDYKTRFDICMVGGDYDGSKVYGPLFAFEDVAFYDMDVSGTDTVAEGMNFHITAKIKGYSSAGQYIILEPVSMKVR